MVFSVPLAFVLSAMPAVALYSEGQLVNARELRLEGEGGQIVVFDVSHLPPGMVTARIEVEDSLGADNEVYLEIPAPQTPPNNANR